MVTFEEDKQFKQMINLHADEVRLVQTKKEYIKLLELHAYEIKTHPLPNNFKQGDKVSVYEHGLGKIHALTSDGTVCVKFDGCCLVRDFHPYAVSLIPSTEKKYMERAQEGPKRIPGRAKRRPK